MQLNPDVARDVLLFLEKELKYEINEGGSIKHNEITLYQVSNDSKLCKKHQSNDIAYTITQLIEDEYVSTIRVNVKNGVIESAIIVDITPKGHEFLDNIHSDTIWNATKKRAKVIGKVSLSALAQGAKFLTDLWMSNPDKFNEIVSQVHNFMQQ
ncbi:DUF2513 domain-containing protein [Lachnospiraceae bacterium MD329]|nr:DUF2513 domain-containing protein [Lachnospiraceae bacterium MD329]